MRRVWRVPVVCLHAVGYLTFVLAVAMLSASATVLGERHELGYFAGRLAQAIRRYPEVTRHGVQMAWLCWAVLLVLAVSPLSPTHWDEVALVAVAGAVLWRRLLGGRTSGR